ncbi:MAG: carotenoid biosynthesis protein [Bacteroidales bacterium]|nr:carotenoid biosynthesis protein [Bacteroidales bacterium]
MNELRPNKMNEHTVLSCKQKWMIGLTMFFFLIFLYQFLRVVLIHVFELPALPGGIFSKLLPPLLFGILYFWYARGGKTAAFLVLFLWVYCWAAEELSVHSGFPFGHYYYSDALGPKLDVVPVMLGLNYFWLLVLPAFFVSNLMVNGKFTSQGNDLKRLLFTSVVASILISGIDMIVDPLDATKMKEWVWTNNAYTGYYGIPYLNYLGYVIVMTPAFFILGVVSQKLSAKAVGRVPGWFAAVILLFYFLNFLMYGLPAPGGVFIVGCFTMLLPLILATDRLIMSYQSGHGNQE